MNTEKRISSSYAGTTDTTKTWVDRLTDKSNMWLNATRSEDEGNIDDAIIFYLKDAKESLSRGSLVEAALSSSCAASCLASVGSAKHAQRLFLESAKIYEENADISMQTSVREALWSLEKAYLNYLLAKEDFKSQHIYDRFFSISKKINPFIVNTNLSSVDVTDKTDESKKQSRVDEKVLKEFKDFLNIRLVSSKKVGERRL